MRLKPVRSRADCGSEVGFRHIGLIAQGGERRQVVPCVGPLFGPLCSAGGSYIRQAENLIEKVLAEF